MRQVFLILYFALTFSNSHGQSKLIEKSQSENKLNLNAYQLSVYKTIDSLNNYLETLLIHQDTAAMKLFYPEDMIITNPFGQMINKETMIERVKAGIIKYSQFEKVIEHFSMPDDKIAIVVGKEIVTPTKDANRTDAGKQHERRITEIWVYRDNTWKKLIRHASIF